jgi:hypothetical protein
VWGCCVVIHVRRFKFAHNNTTQIQGRERAGGSTVAMTGNSEGGLAWQLAHQPTGAQHAATLAANVRGNLAQRRLNHQVRACVSEWVLCGSV